MNSKLINPKDLQVKTAAKNILLLYDGMLPLKYLV